MVMPVMTPSSTVATACAAWAPMRPPMASKLMIGAEVKPWPGFTIVKSATWTPVTPEREETV